MSQDHDERSDDRRQATRFDVAEPIRATITGQDGELREATLKDISAGGAGLIVDGTFENEAFVDLHMEGMGHVNARVARSFAKGVGVEFDLEDSPHKAEMEEELKKFRLAIANQEA